MLIVLQNLPYTLMSAPFPHLPTAWSKLNPRHCSIHVLEVSGSHSHFTYHILDQLTFNITRNLIPSPCMLEVNNPNGTIWLRNQNIFRSHIVMNNTKSMNVIKDIHDFPLHVLRQIPT